ncbi:hypothetical protein HPP92_022035 [Vanilla planifolia]|uniref:LysM domain-containing protein n=1 Tax=Vanilla planifolia TaxID=51239 RepID=A0A835UHP1_VANPL|nr:hypothetical protein HPP92_022035 [Vanilla planifolia]
MRRGPRKDQRIRSLLLPFTCKKSPTMASPSSLASTLLLSMILAFLLSACSAQQPFTNNLQLRCYDTNASSTLGYSCNGASRSCTAFLTFRAGSPYLSPDRIALLLSADANNISRLNSVTDVTTLPSGDLVVVPVSCYCSGRDASFYQHNASYTLKTVSETYLTVANDTYQGLSTCQALMNQNPFDSRHLSVRDELVVPLRCACPTKNQTSAGIKYLLSYIVTWGDDIPTIAQNFKADYQSVLFANELDSKSIIYPFNTLLIPLTTEPSGFTSSPSSPPPNATSNPPPSTPTGGSGSSHTGLIVGVVIGGAVLFLVGALAIYVCLQRRLPQNQPTKGEPVSAEYGELPGKTTSLSTTATPSPLASTIRGALDWITVYKFAELQIATSYFNEVHRIRGSVYKAEINGVAAAEET